MALAFLFIFEVASTFLEFAQLAQDLFPPKQPDISTVRVVLGENSNFGASLGGHVPGVALWNRFGQEIGHTNSDKERLAQGSFIDIQVEHDDDVGNIPAEYLSVSAGGIDAICVAWITITFPDGGSTNVLPGDAGSRCGFTWFESKRELAIDGHAPRCLWIDKDHSNGLQHQGFGVHLRDFTESEARGNSYVNNTDLLCKSGPRFRMYEDLKANSPILYFDPELEYTEEGVDKDFSKVINNPGKSTLTRRWRKVDESTTEDDDTLNESLQLGSTDLTTPNLSANTPIPLNRAMFDGRLVVSNLTGHSARNLCMSESSFGPDFVALSESLFCDMGEKKLYEFCSTSKTSCCFDVDASELRPCYDEIRGNSTARRRSAAPTRTYSDVHRWGTPGDR